MRNSRPETPRAAPPPPLPQARPARRELVLFPNPLPYARALNPSSRRRRRWLLLQRSDQGRGGATPSRPSPRACSMEAAAPSVGSPTGCASLFLPYIGRQARPATRIPSRAVAGGTTSSQGHCQRSSLQLGVLPALPPPAGGASSRGLGPGPGTHGDDGNDRLRRRTCALQGAPGGDVRGGAGQQADHVPHLQAGTGRGRSGPPPLQVLL